MTTELAIFLVLFILTAWGFFKILYHRYRLVRLGGAEGRFDSLAKRLGDTLFYVFSQKGLIKARPITGSMHLMVFWAEVVFLLGTTNHMVEGFVEGFYIFGSSRLGFYYATILDLFAALVLVASVYFFVRRYLFHPTALTLPSGQSAIVLVFLITLMFSFLLYEGSRSLIEPSLAKGAWLGVLTGGWLQQLNLREGGLPLLLLVFWWVHTLLVFSFVVYVPYSKQLHIFAGPINYFFRNRRPLGEIPLLNLEDAETYGVEKITDFSWKHLLDLFACIECGRCQDQCPAYQSQKPLTPKGVIVNLKEHLLKGGSRLLKGRKGQEALAPTLLVDKVVTPDELWTCTACGACINICPMRIEQLPKIISLRQNQVLMESKFPAQLTIFFKNLESNYNPWGIGFATRAEWAEGLDVPLIADSPDAQLLYWVGCAGAFDERNKRVARTMVEILKRAGVRFTILGKEERCCGDAARRTGNEYLYQTLAMENIEILKKYNIKEIITTCPHCYNTLKNEYPQLGGDFQVYHHSQFLFKLVEEGVLRPEKRVEQLVTYHDPCYLGRFNKSFAEPRGMLTAIPGVRLKEMERRKDMSFCCGAGGGQMWMEETLGTRVYLLRTEEALRTDAQMIATACPYCLTMLTDGVKDKGVEEKVKVKDIAEFLAEAL